jgi:hypothetical protein
MPDQIDEEVRKVLREPLKAMPGIIRSGLFKPGASASYRLGWTGIAIKLLNEFAIPEVSVNRSQLVFAIRISSCRRRASDTCRATGYPGSAPTAAKNTTDIQACESGSLFVTIATAIVSAAIPHIRANTIQHWQEPCGVRLSFPFALESICNCLGLIFLKITRICLARERTAVSVRFIRMPIAVELSPVSDNLRSVSTQGRPKRCGGGSGSRFLPRPRSSHRRAAVDPARHRIYRRQHSIPLGSANRVRFSGGGRPDLAPDHAVSIGASCRSLCTRNGLSWFSAQ